MAGQFQQRTDLAQSAREIAVLKDRIAEHCELIENLERDRQDTAGAEEFFGYPLRDASPHARSPSVDLEEQACKKENWTTSAGDIARNMCSLAVTEPRPHTGRAQPNGPTFNAAMLRLQ